MDKFGQSDTGRQITEGEKEKRKIEIYGATYLVSAYYKEQGGMTVTDKVARLIDREAQTA